MTYLETLQAERKERLARLQISKPRLVQIVETPLEPVPILPAPAQKTEPEAGLPTVNGIIDFICRQYNVSRVDMKSARRYDKIAWPRQIAMYLASKLTKQSFVVIGRIFGGRDHTTVLHAVRKVHAAIEENQGFAAQITGYAADLLSMKEISLAQFEAYYLPRKIPNPWTSAEIKILKEMIERGYYPSQIGRRLKRTRSAIWNMARKQGFPIGNYHEHPLCVVPVAEDTL